MSNKPKDTVGPIKQENFERLSQMMADKGVRHEAFELLADLRKSEHTAYARIFMLEHEILDRIAGAAKQPRIMKRYPDDGKPTAAGWYWIAYHAYKPEPAYFDGFRWHESESEHEMILDPYWWLEMENRPTIPEGEA